ncbi:MAG: alanine/glycine:cation symporter family protein [Acidobacteriota bacterium]
MSDILQGASNFVWGPPMLVFLVGTGFFLTILLRGLQFRKLLPSLHLALVKRREQGAQGDVSHFQALMTALAATVGTGNIAGVATAIAAGGPGALFWMWITGLVGMATKYGEALLSVKYRIVDDRGEMSGGPMYYIHRGLNLKWLAVIFSIFTVFAGFGAGNMVQSNSVADALNESFGIPFIWTAIIIALLTGIVILGGIHSIARVASALVPIMIVFYMLAGLIILAINWRGIPDIFTFVILEAFSPTAAVGGFAGATVMQAIRFGVARGVFSNESGLGSAGIAAAAAQTKHPVSQALVSMTQTFIDTLVVCSVTGFVIIATGAWKTGATGAALTTAAFSTGLPGSWGGIIVSLGLALFAFSTILGWSYYGEKALEFLFGHSRFVPYYRLVWVSVTFLGPILTLQTVWNFADVMNGAMAIPNLIALLGLSGVILAETRDYFKRL